MDREVYNELKRLGAKILHIEEIFHDISQFAEDLESECTRTHKELATQINTALREMGKEVVDLRDKINSVCKDYETDYKEIESRISNLESIHGIATKR